MTNAIDSSPIQQTTDAEFRAWGAQFSAALDALGIFPKTADSGQINWATATRVGVNTEAGYEIRRLNDSLAGTYPVYVRIGFGSQGLVTIPRMQLSVGTGSNGSGTLTGQFSNAQSLPLNNTNTAPSAISYTSYYCAVDGYVAALFKCAPTGSAHYGWFIIQRSVDDTGSPNGDGVVIYYNNSTSGTPLQISCRFNDGGSATSGTSVSHILQPPGFPSNTLGGTPPKYQLVRHYWYSNPYIRPLAYVANSMNGDALTTGTIFQAAMVGTTLRTFIVPPTSVLQGSAQNRLTMVWE